VNAPWASPFFLLMRGLLVLFAVVLGINAVADGRLLFSLVWFGIAALGVVLIVAGRRIR
jgi:hypothetical protein